MTKKTNSTRARLQAMKAPEPPLDYKKMQTWEVQQCLVYLKTKVLALEIQEVAEWVRGRIAQAEKVLESRGVKITER